MHYETATSFGLNIDRAQPSKKQRKRGSLSTAIRNHQAMIARKGTASALDRITLDAATNAVIAEAKMKAVRR
jgi:hypothetical protein